jgi:hypothetical protein
MGNVWLVAALWVGLALAATLLAIWLKVSTALSEIVVGTVAQLIIGVLIGHGSLGGSAEWITFLAGAGSILLTFLAGAELDPTVFRRKWREATAIGDRPHRILRAVSRRDRRRALPAWMGPPRGMAGRRGALDHVGRRRVWRDAGTGLQPHGVRQVRSRGVFRLGARSEA